MGFQRKPLSQSNMKLLVLSLLCLVISVPARRVKRQSDIDDELDDIKTLVELSGDNSLIVISNEIIAFIQEKFYPVVEDIKMDIANPDPVMITQQVFELVKDAGERMARASDNYKTLVITEEDDERIEALDLASKIGCGIKFAGHGLHSVMDVITATEGSATGGDITVEIVHELLGLTRDIMNFSA